MLCGSDPQQRTGECFIKYSWEKNIAPIQNYTMWPS
ncbi:MAG: hypothetical protein QOH05_4772, partial [Acetobacteraceae bacterium]|nr:hypothetical protein [Acetobacteraceae bacterium]